MNNCYRCAHADFKTPHQVGMSGFANCNPLKQKYKYLPSCHICDIGKFNHASDEVMKRRKVFFKTCGKAGCDD